MTCEVIVVLQHSPERCEICRSILEVCQQYTVKHFVVDEPPDLVIPRLFSFLKSTRDDLLLIVTGHDTKPLQTVSQVIDSDRDLRQRAKILDLTAETSNTQIAPQPLKIGDRTFNIPATSTLIPVVTRDGEIVDRLLKIDVPTLSPWDIPDLLRAVLESLRSDKPIIWQIKRRYYDLCRQCI